MAVFISVGVTTVIVLLWLFSFGTMVDTGKKADVEKTGPISAVFSNITDMIADTIYTFNNAKDKLPFPAYTVYPKEATSTRAQ